MKSWLAIPLAISFAATCSGVEFSPSSPAPEHALIHIRLETGGELYLVFGIKPGANFEVVDVELAPTVDGTFVWTGPPGRYLIAGKEAVRFQKIYEIRGGAGPAPPEPAPPGPTPAPPTNWGLTGKAEEWAAEIQPEGRPLILAIAKNFEAAAAAIGSGAVTTLTGATKLVADANARTFGADSTKYWRSWLARVGFTVDTLEDQGKLTTASQKAEVFQEIAAGLRRYAAKNRLVSRSTKRATSATLTAAKPSRVASVAPPPVLLPRYQPPVARIVPHGIPVQRPQPAFRLGWTRASVP